MDLTTSWVGLVSLVTFVLAYGLVIAEEFTRLRKSVPVIVAAGVIWSVIGFHYAQSGATRVAQSIPGRIQSPVPVPARGNDLRQLNDRAACFRRTAHETDA